ncbi:hypothetical protein RHMOL_Rhmol11G0107400 [Rhododendron molle]|uniref:Uncharacterized protein n=1 Tax=Rhododendron molle TaxID=49168 RepID=A0ACC0LQV3_RHOML|nr:hypothetical protein RHMOL_Rhmol11G0107400 [Rhododendron molle]
MVMVLTTPFVGIVQRAKYDKIDNTGCWYALINVNGEQEDVAFSRTRSSKNLLYEGHAPFVAKYGQILPIGIATTWNLRKEMDAWLSKIIYYSFLYFSHDLDLMMIWLDNFGHLVLFIFLIDAVIVQVFTHQFQAILQDPTIDVIVFRMKNFTWKVPIKNGCFQSIGMEILQNELKLEDSDLIFVAVKDPGNIRLLVLCSNGLEKMYSWFYE